MAQCQKCGYEWEPRIKNPKECPDCKSRNWADGEPSPGAMGEIDLSTIPNTRFGFEKKEIVDDEHDPEICQEFNCRKCREIRKG